MISYREKDKNERRTNAINSNDIRRKEVEETKVTT